MLHLWKTCGKLVEILYIVVENACKNNVLKDLKHVYTSDKNDALK
jgi:hypothetical protein